MFGGNYFGSSYFGQIFPTSPTVQTITGRSRITVTTLQTISGKANVNNNTVQALTGKSRILSTISKPNSRIILLRDGRIAIRIANNVYLPL